MTGQDARATSDARLACCVAAAALVAFTSLVALPVHVTDLRLPSGVDAVWLLAGQLTLLLGPVVAGLAAYASVVALWSRGDALPASARRLHLVTLLVAAALFAGLVSTWGTDVVSWWTD